MMPFLWIEDGRDDAVEGGSGEVLRFGAAEVASLVEGLVRKALLARDAFPFVAGLFERIADCDFRYRRAK